MDKGAYLRDFELIVLLAVLRLGDDAYGVSIARELKAQARREPSLANVNATLDRLQVGRSHSRARRPSEAIF